MPDGQRINWRRHLGRDFIHLLRCVMIFTAVSAAVFIMGVIWFISYALSSAGRAIDIRDTMAA